MEPMPDARMLPTTAIRRWRSPGLGTAGVHRRPAAPAAAPARRTDPSRSAALAGERGCRTARHHGRIGEQRPSARAGDAWVLDVDGEQVATLDDEHRALLQRYLDAFESYDMDRLTACCTRTRSGRCRPALWLHTNDDIRRWCLGPGIAPAAALAWSRSRRTACRALPNTSPRRRRPRRVVATDRRDLRRPDQRHHVLPRHGAVLPAVRAAAPPRR